MKRSMSFSAETSERYALAFMEVSKEMSELDKNLYDTQNLLQIFKDNKYFVKFIKNPTIGSNNQKKIFEKIINSMSFSNSFKNFLFLLIKKKRIFFLDQILKKFIQISKLNKGIMEAKLVSSKELTDEEQKKISDELSKAIGASLTFNYSVNENLLGGFKIQVGSILIDTSIRNKLNRYLTLTTNNR